MSKTTKNSLADKIVALLHQKHLLSVPEMLRHLAQQQDHYNKTSVYRALEKLAAQGQVCRYNFGEDQAMYELRDHHHDHLVCQTCGQIETAECQLTIPAHLHHFQVDHHHLTIFGLCQKCQ